MRWVLPIVTLSCAKAPTIESDDLDPCSSERWLDDVGAALVEIDARLQASVAVADVLVSLQAQVLRSANDVGPAEATSHASEAVGDSLDAIDALQLPAEDLSVDLPMGALDVVLPVWSVEALGLLDLDISTPSAAMRSLPPIAQARATVTMDQWSLQDAAVVLGVHQADLQDTCSDQDGVAVPALPAEPPQAELYDAILANLSHGDRATFGVGSALDRAEIHLRAARRLAIEGTDPRLPSSLRDPLGAAIDTHLAAIAEVATQARYETWPLCDGSRATLSVHWGVRATDRITVGLPDLTLDTLGIEGVDVVDARAAIDTLIRIGGARDQIEDARIDLLGFRSTMNAIAIGISSLEGTP